MSDETALAPVAPPEAEVLPPLPGLTPLQSAFVRCYVAHGDGNATAAALAAGYAPAGAANMGYRLLRDQQVLEAIHAETVRAIGAAGPIALKRMVSLLDHRSGFVAHQAAKDLLDRVGHAPTKGMQAHAGGITIDIKLTPD